MIEPRPERWPRPLADAPVELLRARADELAKAWLGELIAAGPLARAAELPVAELVAAAPRLCALAAEALGSDAQLHRLGAEDVVARAGRLAGAGSPAEISGAVEVLRGVLWSAAIEALPRPSAALVADLAQRLAHICATITAVALGAGHAGADEGWDHAPRARDLRRPGPEAEAPAWPAGSAPAEAPGSGPTAPARQAPESAGPEAGAPVAPSPEPPAPNLRKRGSIEPELSEQPDPWSAVAETSTSSPDAVSEGSLPGEGAWRAAIDRRLQRRAVDGAPFAALLIELDGLERLLVAETGREVAAAIEAVEVAVSGALRPADVVARGGLGRYWIVAPATGSQAAHELALRLAEAARGSASHRGTPLTVSIGYAVCPDDGEKTVLLAEHAEQRMFAARAAGVPSFAPPSGAGG